MPNCLFRNTLQCYLCSCTWLQLSYSSLWIILEKVILIRKWSSRCIFQSTVSLSNDADVLQMTTPHLRYVYLKKFLKSGKLKGTFITNRSLLSYRWHWQFHTKYTWKLILYIYTNNSNSSKMKIRIFPAQRCIFFNTSISKPSALSLKV